MTSQYFMAILAIIFTFLGSFYLVVGNFQSAIDIVLETIAWAMPNYPLRISLITMRVYSTVGFFFLGMALFLQMLSLFIPNKVFKIKRPFLIIIVITLFVIISSYIFIHIEKNNLLKRTKIIQIGIIESGDHSTTKQFILKYYPTNYVEFGKEQLFIEKRTTETNEEYLDRLCNDIDSALILESRPKKGFTVTK